jgi:hypothetical protein
MIKIPLGTIIDKIKEQKGLSEEDIRGKIKDRMEQLSGLISEEGAAHIIANELGVQLLPSGSVKISEIVEGMRSVETAGKVQRNFGVREFSTGDRQGKVGSFILADESGTIRVTCWQDQTEFMENLQENDVVKIVDGYVKENNGQKEVHLNTRSRLVKNPENIQIGEVATFQRPEAGRKKIIELEENDKNTEILGTIVQVYDLKFFEQCPDCRKRARVTESGAVCDQHGNVTPLYSYVMNAFIDDGSGSIRTVFFTNQAQNLLKKNDDDIQVFRTSPELFEQVKNGLLGEMVKIAGKVTKNQMFDRLEFMANMVNRDVDPKEEIERLKKESENAGAVEEKQEETVAVETPAPVESVTPQPVQQETQVEQPPVQENVAEAVQQEQPQPVQIPEQTSTPEQTEVKEDSEEKTSEIPSFEDV